MCLELLNRLIALRDNILLVSQLLLEFIDPRRPVRQLLAQARNLSEKLLLARFASSTHLLLFLIEEVAQVVDLLLHFCAHLLLLFEELPSQLLELELVVFVQLGDLVFVGGGELLGAR